MALQGTGLSIADVDAGTSAVQARLSVGEGTLSAVAGSSGVTVSGAGSGMLTLDGTVAAINALLSGAGGASVSYQAVAAPSASTTLTLSVDDLGNSGSGGAQSDSASVALNVTAVNDAPVATIAAASVDVGTNSQIPLHGSGLMVADEDAGASPVLATLNVGDGTLIVAAGTSGVLVNGSGSAAVDLTGSVVAINRLLAGLDGATVHYAVGTSGAISTVLTLSVSDLGNTGVGGALSASDAATLEMMPTAGEEQASTAQPIAIDGLTAEPAGAHSGEAQTQQLIDSEAQPVPVANNSVAHHALVTAVATDESKIPPPVAQQLSFGLPPVGVAQVPEASSAQHDQSIVSARSPLALLRELFTTKVEAPSDVRQGADADVSSRGGVAQLLLQRFDHLRDEVAQDSNDLDIQVASSITVTSGFSIGYVVWLLRSGALLSSILSSLPAWRTIDPLPILGRIGPSDEDRQSLDPVADEHLEDIIEDAKQHAKMSDQIAEDIRQ